MDARALALAPHRRARVDHDIYRGSHLQPNLRLLFSPATDLALWGGLSRANRTVSRGESDSVVKISVIPPGTPANPGTLPIQLLAGGARDPNLLDNRYTDAFGSAFARRAAGSGPSTSPPSRTACATTSAPA